MAQSPGVVATGNSIDITLKSYEILHITDAGGCAGTLYEWISGAFTEVSKIDRYSHGATAGIAGPRTVRISCSGGAIGYDVIGDDPATKAPGLTQTAPSSGSFDGAAQGLAAGAAAGVAQQAWVSESEIAALSYISRLSTLPTPQERTAIERLFRALGAAGLLSVLDALYVGAATDGDSRLNLLGTSGTLTKTNAPAWTKYRGYRGNGVNASLDSGINPSTASGLNYTLNSACLFGYLLSQPTVSAGVVGRGVSPTYAFVNPTSLAAKMLACVNETLTGTSNSNGTSPQKNGLGLSVAVREGAGAVKLYRGSVLIATGTSASTAIPNGTIRGLTGEGSFTDAELGAWGFGGAMTAAQVAALNTALRTYFTDLGQAVVDPATPYGVWRGTWNVGGNQIGAGGGVLFATRDIILYSGSYYFCISGYTTTSGSAAPNVDTTHWEPIPLFAEVTLFDDDFGDRPGVFSGRTAGAFTWTTTGTGYLNAQVVVPVDGDGYASSLLNTYYQVVDITSPPTMIGAIESDAAEPHFTLAIGGSDVASWSTEMVHINFTATGADGRFWHAGEVGVNLTSGSKYASNAGALSLTAGQKYQVEMHIRGNFLFGFLDSALVYTVCNDLVGTIASVATEVYTQNQLQTDTGGVQYAFGDQKVYRVWCKSEV